MLILDNNELVLYRNDICKRFPISGIAGIIIIKIRLY